MLSAGGLQALLKHLHQLLLPIITLSVSNTAESGGLPAPSGATDSKVKLAVTAKDLDILLAVLEALASSDAAADGHDASQVCVLCCPVGHCCSFVHVLLQPTRQSYVV